MLNQLDHPGAPSQFKKIHATTNFSEKKKRARDVKEQEEKQLTAKVRLREPRADRESREPQVSEAQGRERRGEAARQKGTEAPRPVC